MQKRSVLAHVLRQNQTDASMYSSCPLPSLQEEIPEDSRQSSGFGSVLDVLSFSPGFKMLNSISADEAHPA
jgi:hypothetical protein